MLSLLSESDDLVAPVLRVVDRAVLWALPLIATAVVISPPAFTWWMIPSLGLFALALGVALLGRYFGGSRWRLITYPLVTLGVATTALWSMGPLLGVGACYGLGAVLAAMLMSQTAAAITITIGVIGIVLRASMPEAHQPTALVFDAAPIWFRVAIGSGLMMWMATRILSEITGSLDRSYLRVAAAFQLDAESKSQLDRTRQELDEAEQVELVGRLAGGVAHDVNNALTAILAASDVLGDKASTPRQRRNLTALEAASQHAAELVRDLLWIGQQFPPSVETASLFAVVQASRGRLERMGRQLAIELDVDDALCAAIAPERLEQIVFWLMLRARRAGVTQIAVTGRREGDHVELTLRGLSDGTPSASLDLRPRVVQAKLNSAAAKEVVEQVGGTLTMSDDVGVLSVEIRLPVARDDARPPPVFVPRPRTALVVDDDPRVLGRLAKLVARRGYTVATATSLAEAWPLLALDPDLLVTDLQLGDGLGDELAIASFTRTPARPIVVCSGFGASDALNAALQGARVSYLSKPFTMRELEHVIPHTGDGGDT